VDLQSSTSQDSLYIEAYEWTKHAPLSDWHMQDATPEERQRVAARLHAPQADSLYCQTVSYQCDIKMPNVLLSYIHIGTFRGAVHKIVCVDTARVYTIVNLSSFPVVNSIEIRSVMSVDRASETVHVETDAEYAIPWYLEFLTATSEAILLASYKDEVEETVRQMCRASG